MDVTKCPGKIISQFVKDAIDIVREKKINMNIVRPNQVPQLTWSALTGLLMSSNTEIRSRARMMRLDNDGDEFGAVAGQKFKAADAIDALNVFDRMCHHLMNASDCGPAKTAERHKAILVQTEAQTLKIQALEASLTQLQQDRGAHSANGANRDKFDTSIAGTTVAKCCCRCGPFAKGSTAHCTSEHTGTRQHFPCRADSGAATPAPTPAPAPKYLMGW